MGHELPLENMLRAHEFAHGMDEEHIRTLVSMAELRTYRAGDHILTAGTPADFCYLIRDGHVTVELPQAPHTGYSIQSLGNNQILGWSWLIPPYRWCFDATARNLTHVVVLDASRLRHRMEEDPRFGYAVLKRVSQVCAERLHASRMQMLEMLEARRHVEEESNWV